MSKATNKQTDRRKIRSQKAAVPITYCQTTYSNPYYAANPPLCKPTTETSRREHKKNGRRHQAVTLTG